MRPYENSKFINHKIHRAINSLAAALLAHHAIFPFLSVGEERLRDEPKERLRGRLVDHDSNSVHINSVKDSELIKLCKFSHMT